MAKRCENSRLVFPFLLPRATLIAGLACCLLLAACGGEPARIMVFAMDGPPLSIAGEQGRLEPLQSGYYPAGTREGRAPGTAIEQGAAERERTKLDSGVEIQFAAAPGGAPSTGAVGAPKVAVHGRVVFEGEMERACMVGNGVFMLSSLDGGRVCRGEVKTGPGYKGRIRGIIPCGEGEFFLFTLNHQGPDQGAGIGRFAAGSGSVDDETTLELDIDEGAPLLFFYHPSLEEAKRRLAGMQSNLAEYLRDEERRLEKQ